MTDHVLKQCTCGCNTYSPRINRTGPLVDYYPLVSTSSTSLIELTYEDDIGPLDPELMVSIPAIQFAELLKIAKECNCGTDGSSDV